MPPAQTPDDRLVTDWQRIRAGVSHVQRHLDETVERAGLPSPWFATMYMLLRAPEHGLPMTVLARDLAMTSGGFTKLADRMARDGLIDRRGFAGDRRVVHAALTAAGRRLAVEIEARYVAALRESLVDVVSAEELTAAGETLARVTAAHAALRADANVDPKAADDPDLLTTQRDPALPDRREPDRRGRGRASE